MTLFGFEANSDYPKKLDRIDYALSQINLATLTTRGPMKFNDLEDVVHGDEKWFYLCEDGERYILVDDEDDPKRQTRHKGYITKIMFLNFQAKPAMFQAGVGGMVRLVSGLLDMLNKHKRVVSIVWLGLMSGLMTMLTKICID
jgi:hypothetical protein